MCEPSRPKSGLSEGELRASGRFVSPGLSSHSDTAVFAASALPITSLLPCGSAITNHFSTHEVELEDVDSISCPNQGWPISHQPYRRRVQRSRPDSPGTQNSMADADMMQPTSPDGSSPWPSDYSSSDCACRLEISEEGPQEAQAPLHRQQHQCQQQEVKRALGSAGDGINSASGTNVSASATASTGSSGGGGIYGLKSSRRSRSRSRAQRFVNAYVAPLWGPRMAALRKRCSPLWLYTVMACASIVVAASFLLGPSAVAQLGPSSAEPLLLLTAGVRSRLGDDEHGQLSRDAHLFQDGAQAIADTEPPMDRSEDAFCQTQLVQEREKSWNESGLEFLSPRLVRNGSRAVLCFYDRRAHRLPPPHSFFPRQMALRYCTHAVYHAPFALHDGRLAYRNPGFDRQFGMPELARVARQRGYGTRLLFTVGGEETDNANWSRLASDSVQKDALAADLKATLVSLGYDGVNLHWPTPGGRCGRAGDARALTDLVRLLRSRLRRPAAPRDFLLVVTLPPQEHFVEMGSQIEPLAKLADFLVLQTHSLYGPSSPWPRCASPYEAAQGPSVRSLLDSLAARLFHGHWGKLCVTQSLAALTYRLADNAANHAEGDSASVGPGEPQFYTGSLGRAAFFEVCGWTRQRSRSRECSLLRSGRTVAAFEGPEALRHKLARMALDGHGRLCMAALDTHMDDPLGFCGGPMSPLLKRLYEDPLEA